eukprot:Opistho-2@69438
MVPPWVGLGWQIRARPRDTTPAAGASNAHSMAPAGPAIRRFSVCEFMARPSAADVVGQHQAADDLTALQVLLDDLVDIAGIDIAVPGRLRIDHGHRAAGTAVQAARLVDTHAPLATETQLADLGLAVIEAGLRSVLSTAVVAVLAVIEAEED